MFFNDAHTHLGGMLKLIDIMAIEGPKVIVLNTSFEELEKSLCLLSHNKLVSSHHWLEHS